MTEEEIPLESGHFRRGPGGRPTRLEAERRHRELLDTTKRLLLERGWEATSIDEISRQSGVAKRFLYARYPDKSALFFAAVAQFRDEQIGALGTLVEPPDDVEEGLHALATQLFDLAMREETLAIIRLFLAEAPRMRDFAKLFAESFPRRGLSGIGRFLSIYAERGILRFPDPAIRRRAFRDAGHRRAAAPGAARLSRRARPGSAKDARGGEAVSRWVQIKGRRESRRFFRKAVTVRRRRDRRRLARSQASMRLVPILRRPRVDLQRHAQLQRRHAARRPSLWRRA